ncbi:MAG TPA: diaminopimelate epimerase [Gemmatimonadales bacterium]
MSRTTGQVFYKMTGSGNDFVMLDGRLTNLEEWPAERIAAACDRRLGIGADGLVLLTPEPEGGDGIRMEYFNSDGSYAAMCGNAALCSTRLAAFLEMAPSEGMTLVTGAGLVRTRCAGGDHLAELQLPPFQVPVPVPIECREGESGFWCSTVGVPHLIVLTDDAMAVDVEGRGRELRFHPALGSAGANVNFVSPSRSSSDGAPWLIRTYERGVEAETLACGTGTLAAAFALHRAGIRSLPGEWETCRGIRLAVAGTLEGDQAVENWLCGEGRLVFTGILR